jgi:hypothetical protein
VASCGPLIAPQLPFLAHLRDPVSPERLLDVSSGQVRGRATWIKLLADAPGADAGHDLLFDRCLSDVAIPLRSVGVGGAAAAVDVVGRVDGGLESALELPRADAGSVGIDGLVIGLDLAGLSLSRTAFAPRRRPK